MNSSKVVLVTGSSSGFGRLTVETLAGQGYTVFAGIRGSDTKNSAVARELSQLAQNEKLALEVIELDVTNDASVEQATRHVIEQAGRLDVVINNAGLAANGPLEAFSPAQIQQLFETNVFGIIRVNRAVLPQMRKQQSGLLVQISSVAGRQAFPFIGLYAATKFAVEALSETSRQELAALGIDVVVVEPDAYATNILANGILAADNARSVPYADFMAQVAGFVQAASQDSNPQEVADAIATLLATPAGQRPLRLIVAPEGRYAGLEALNSLSAEISAGTAAALGWEAFTTLASAPKLASAGVNN